MSKWCLKHFMQIAGILMLLGADVQAARNSRLADVTVYVKGDDEPPGPIDWRARATVTGMYARIGIRLAWSNDAFRTAAVAVSPVSIEIQFARESPQNARPHALAFALPFADGANAITIMYNRIRKAAGDGGSVRAQHILAHVLAHEIGHVLQGIEAHAKTGVMKGRWDVFDFDAMEEKPLEFTPGDVVLIVRGLAARKARSATRETEKWDPSPKARPALAIR